jgi:hypothetical protein
MDKLIMANVGLRSRGIEGIASSIGESFRISSIDVAINDLQLGHATRRLSIGGYPV